jgi:hypothetical protein
MTSSTFIRVVWLGLIGLGGFGLNQACASTRVSVGVGIGVPLPHGYVEVSSGRDRYYYHRGTFYRPGHNGYYVTRAPRGCVVRELPSRYSRVYFGSSLYYRYNNVYYQDYPGGYVVVDPPSTVVVQVPASATAAPTPLTKDDDYQSAWVGDVEYLFKDGQFFKKTSEGLVWAEAPLGAITKTLPSDARSVWYEEIEYFECEEIYFRKTPDGYKVIEVPWKTVESAPVPAAPAK